MHRAFERHYPPTHFQDSGGVALACYLREVPGFPARHLRLCRLLCEGWAVVFGAAFARAVFIPGAWIAAMEGVREEDAVLRHSAQNPRLRLRRPRAHLAALLPLVPCSGQYESGVAITRGAASRAGELAFGAPLFCSTPLVVRFCPGVPVALAHSIAPSRHRFCDICWPIGFAQVSALAVWAHGWSVRGGATTYSACVVGSPSSFAVVVSCPMEAPAPETGCGARRAGRQSL